MSFFVQVLISLLFDVSDKKEMRKSVLQRNHKIKTRTYQCTIVNQALPSFIESYSRLVLYKFYTESLFFNILKKSKIRGRDQPNLFFCCLTIPHQLIFQNQTPHPYLKPFFCKTNIIYLFQIINIRKFFFFIIGQVYVMLLASKFPVVEKFHFYIWKKNRKKMSH